jgi:hypothetical protein
MHRNIGYKIIKIDPIEVLADDDYLRLCEEVRLLGYISFSDYFKTEIIAPLIKGWMVSGNIDYVSFKERLLKLDKNNLDKLQKFSHDKQMPMAYVVATVMDKFLKDKEK